MPSFPILVHPLYGGTYCYDPRCYSSRLIIRYRVSRWAPPISHLLFADDSLFFFRAKTHEAHIMKSIMNMYAAASSQLVNFEKSGANLQ
ncbi:hypothetical protein LINGRAPRIM_LOCUS127 [Linum grandiflorum]